MSESGRHPTLRSQIASWLLFDTANHSFATIIVTAYYVLYFKSVVVGDPHKGDLLWGLSIGIAMAILACTSPFLGAVADLGGYRRRLLTFFTILCIGATFGLSFMGSGDVIGAVTLFMIAEIGYEGGAIFYDSFLSQISRRENVGRISGYGFAFGYAGDILALLLAIPFLRPHADGSPTWSVWPIRVSVLQFLLLGTPALLLLHDRNRPLLAHETLASQLRLGWKNLRHTFHRLDDYPDLKRLLIAFLIFYDGIATAVSFAAAYAHDTIGLSPSKILWVLLVANTVAIPGAISAGWLCDRIGKRKTILATLLLWIATILALIGSHSPFSFFVITGLVGIGLGSTQGATRALYAQFVPPGSEGQFFALRGICGKFASILGPILFGLVSYFTRNQRLAASSLLIFFVVGFCLVWTIDEERGKAKGAWSS